MMKLDGIGALVSGGASGLGAATARLLTERGAKVAIADRDGEKADELASELGGVAFTADVTEEHQVEAAVQGAAEALGELRLCVSCAGIGWAERVAGKQGPAQLQPFETVVGINLIGMFNVLRYAANAMNGNEPDDDGERGAVVMTSSIAAYDGQIGQTAYAASKGGVASLTLPAARDLSSRGIRVMTIAPGLFDTPLLGALPEEARTALGEQVPFPSRLGEPEEYAELACHIAENRMLNGEVIRLDGALRMPPK
jgi:3-hydroxyacyl-CoA dehydrogenase / 3-hydroxy-2-methylbutyryl-CoA dehydrogenase